MITVKFERVCSGFSRDGGGLRILDVGCGTGRHTCEAYRQPAATVVGTDRCFDDVAEAARRLRFHDAVGEHGGGAWGLNAADILALPFRDAAFDIVICSEVLEHIPDHRSAVREVMRVLRPGGDLVVSVPRAFPERICWMLSREYRNTPGGHIRIYRRRDLIRLVETAGARARAFRVHHAHSLHTPYWWLKCLLGPNRDDPIPIRLYHRFLTWDIMKKPQTVRWAERLFNPVLGKSVVVYFKKGQGQVQSEYDSK